MNLIRTCCCLAGCAWALAAAGEPVRALLVVQNHVSDEFGKPLSNVASRLAAALSGDVFEVVVPDDAVGENQNRAPGGERMPTASATRLAESLGAKALITASIDDVSVESVGNPVVIQKLRLSMSLQAKRLPGGEGVPGVDVTVTSRPFQSVQFANNARPIYAGLVSELCRQSAALLLPRVANVKWNVGGGRVRVAFGCNVAGADVSIDGVSYGTAGTVGQPPLALSVSPGLHNLRVTFPFAHPYSVQANFVDGSTYLITLSETEEGRRRRKDDAWFDELLARYRKSGAMDDFVRSEKAKGYAQYLSSSYTRIEGMPQTLTKTYWNAIEQAPDFALGSVGEDGGVPSTSQIQSRIIENVNPKLEDRK